MLFNSFEFLLFLPIVFFIYWFLTKKNLSIQNTFLLLASYIFYGWWDYRFLFLILLSTTVDYIIGLLLQNKTERFKYYRLLLLSVSICFNLGILFVFKYYNFFIESFAHLFSQLNYSFDEFNTLNIILPVGISFYTFQTLSYTIDVYRKELEPTKSFIEFATYVAFFPQLVAGPIERASSLLPQIQTKRIFNYRQGSEGVRLIIWGLFKKVVIADSLAEDVNFIFSNYSTLNSSTLFLGAIYFSVQIYGDFSGYSDIAIGVAKILGFEIRSNFRFPYFASNISQFWNRWHISLSSWFKDYLYIPLGGSREGILKSIRNVFVVFILSGLWHGANSTYIVWGAIHSILYLPSFIIKRNSTANASIDNNRKEKLLFIKRISCFLIITITWIFFRSPDLNSSLNYIIRMVSFPDLNPQFTDGIILVIIFFSLDWKTRNNERDILFSSKKWKRITLYLLMSFLIYQGLYETKSEFIYFQF
jgi:alginate O-acetyltransferase complex protein AlgI